MLWTVTGEIKEIIVITCWSCFLVALARVSLKRDSEIPKKGVNIISRYRDQMAYCEMQSFSKHRRSEKNCGHGFSDSFDVILDEPIFGWLLRNQMFE